MAQQYRQRRFAPAPGATEILFIRHGESEPFVPGVPVDRLDGQSDPALAPAGSAQASCIADRLVDAGIDAVYVTPLRRTRQTAEPLLGKLGLTALVNPDLREVYLGEWDGGFFRKHVAEGHPLVERLETEQRWDVLPGAERDSAFLARVRRGVETVHAEQPGKRVAVFTHGGVIGCALSQATGSPRLVFARADNGSITRLVVDGPMWHVRSFNDTAHLPEPW